MADLRDSSPLVQWRADGKFRKQRAFAQNVQQDQVAPNVQMFSAVPFSLSLKGHNLLSKKCDFHNT